MSVFTPFSYWEIDTWFNNVDVAIIGGGIVGMSAALYLREKNQKLSIAILERSSIGTAASSRNAGFSCFGSTSELIDDLSKNDPAEVFGLVELRVRGLRLLRKTLGDKALRYRQTGGYEMFLDSIEMEKHLDQLSNLNNELIKIDPSMIYYLSDENRGLHNVAGVICNDWEGQIHPGQMVRELQSRCAEANIRILNGINIEALNDVGNAISLQFDGGEIRAGKVILCNNGFANQLTGDHSTQPGRNMVLVTNPIEDLEIDGCYHYDQGYIYFRNIDKRLLIGGGRNIDRENETTHEFGSNQKVREYLISLLEKHLLPNQDYQIDHEWSGIMGFNTSKRPRIEMIAPNIFTAVGLGGMGVAIGSVIGREAADLLLQS